MLDKIFNFNVNFKGEDYFNLNSKFEFKPGDAFIGSIDTTCRNKDGKKVRENKRKGVYLLSMIEKSTTGKDKYLIQELDGKTFITSENGIHLFKDNTLIHHEVERIKKAVENYKLNEKIETEKAVKKALVESGYSINALSPEEQIKKLITAGQRNMWMVGPAGCGKSTIGRIAAKALNVPYLCISCGIGTSSTEFVGYKYPTREKTKFSDYYGKPSVILIDEITALDPSVGQILNACLANDEIETTTGLVVRDPNCIIIATSNTFGTGGDRMYVANNQLDASTLDRFIGGIIKVDYSELYEKQFDSEALIYANILRNVIKAYDMRKVVSTRFIQSATKLKANGIKDWKLVMLSSWTDKEKAVIKDYVSSKDKLDKFTYYSHKIDDFNQSIFNSLVTELKTSDYALAA
jgi:hypothetical protein